MPNSSHQVLANYRLPIYKTTNDLSQKFMEKVISIQSYLDEFTQLTENLNELNNKFLLSRDNGSIE